MHTLSEITLNNFRSCDEATFPLSDFTPLVGYNNGGKSNILDSIRWLLKSFVLAEKDFNDLEKPVVISGVISGITEELAS
jgi:predicted ATP-dependent endonuclease of OLD family